MKTSQRPRLAKYPTTCPRCDLVIAPGTAYAMRKGQAIHPNCASGADDQ